MFSELTLPAAPLPINTVVPGVPVEGPFPVMAEAVRKLHERFNTCQQ